MTIIRSHESAWTIAAPGGIGYPNLLRIRVKKIDILTSCVPGFMVFEVWETIDELVSSIPQE